jgi:hypothetical protein
MKENEVFYDEYRVYWCIDVTEASPLLAAQAARAIQLDPNSTATYFRVEDKTGKVVLVDI